MTIRILRLSALVMACLVVCAPDDAGAQFRVTWMDIGEMHSFYSEAGAHSEGVSGNRSLEWPAILRGSAHYRAKAYWIGLKNWTDATGRTWDYRVARIGLRAHGHATYIPIETRLVARFEDTDVVVDGVPSYVHNSPSTFDKITILDEVDPELPADRVLYQRYRSILGIETERRVYAYASEWHDDYHIIRRRMINNGNTDADPAIELPGQSLHDVLFTNMYRWVGREQAADHGSNGQLWGKFTMIDIVGDGHQEYPVNFTAIYMWAGYDPGFASELWDNLGSPLLRVRGTEAPGDTIGRLAGMSMPGRVVLHADTSPSNRIYDPAVQPVAIGWIDNDEELNGDFLSERDYYELGMLTRENPAVFPDGSSRMFPHHADRIEQQGTFWAPTRDAAWGRSGGFSPLFTYGPYQMAFGDTLEIVEAEGAAGLSYQAATEIGVAYKNSGLDDALRIPYDANGDGVIADIPWDYDVYKNGSELQTKNQWVMTERDSLFQMMYRARDVWNASAGMTSYPIVEPPRPPRRFEITGHPDRIELRWEPMPGAVDPVQWDVYRTSDYVDKLPYTQIAVLPGSARSYEDTGVIRGVDYYYFLQAVGPANPVDASGIAGTPGGIPLKSGRYFTQSYLPASLVRFPGAQVSDFRIVPNPMNLASDASLRIVPDGNPTRGMVEFLDIPGHCTIAIYTEVGELVRRIEHTDGSGNAFWDMTTSSRQAVVSGIYLVRVVDNDTGATNVKKLVVIL
ncbi:MAG: hypothetical protein R2834_11225 [Rhodothermales bacterium]